MGVAVQGCPFNDQQMAELFSAIRSALEETKLFDMRSEAEQRGMIFTKLRQALMPLGWDNVFPRRRGRLKVAMYRAHVEWAFIEGMVRHMRQEFTRHDAGESLARLRLMLAGLNASVGEMETINTRGEQVMAGLEEVHNILNPPQEETLKALAVMARK